jgi:succinate dehydrogenase / fumarate reductase, cytochrome b subunit
MSSVAEKKPRPKYLSLPAILFEIRLPLPGWVLLLHRISGALLVFPFAAWLLYLFDRSLASPESFAYLAERYLQLPLVKLGLLVFAWAYAHHFCAGIRFLLLDVHKGIDLRSARRSSVLVLVVSLALTAWLGVLIW